MEKLAGKKCSQKIVENLKIEKICGKLKKNMCPKNCGKCKKGKIGGKIQ